MTFCILIHTFRKAGISIEEFQTHIENVLIPLLKSVTGDKFPLSHTRRYIQSVKGPDPCADAIAELAFQDEAALGDFLGVMQQPDVAAKVAEVEGKVVDGSKTSIATVYKVNTTLKE